MTCFRLLTCVTPPATEPVTLAEAKLFLRLDGNAEDTLINDLIPAARAAAEEYMLRSLITQTWKIAFDDRLYNETSLPRGPVQSITSVITYDKNEVAATISSAAYRLNAAKNAIILDSEIAGNRIEVVYVTGYGAAANVPKPIKQGILTHIATLYEQRDADAVMPLSTLGLYNLYREVRL